MNPYSHDMNHALANEKLDRYRAEAASHRLAKSALGDESDDPTRNRRPWGINSLRSGLADLLSGVANSIAPSQQPQPQPLVTE